MSSEKRPCPVPDAAGHAESVWTTRKSERVKSDVNFNRDATTRQAWKEIEQAGLVNRPRFLFLLQGYAAAHSVTLIRSIRAVCRPPSSGGLSKAAHRHHMGTGEEGAFGGQTKRPDLRGVASP
jgi:hypothetical protein